MKTKLDLIHILTTNRTSFHPVIADNLLTSGIHVFDFTENNNDIKQIDLSDKMAYSRYVENELQKFGAQTGIGGYNEDRLIYKRSELFGSGEEARSVHLGLDIWSGQGTDIFTPLDATVHSFRNNDNHGDYGPTIILKHHLEGHVFYSLFGHLSADSLINLYEGKNFAKGDKIARMGTYDENGHWPPHLHFQLIIDMEDYTGDYPGVCKPADRPYYLANCPDPHLIMNINY
ncbi:MAG: peptidoglycan DD-metalloendopeptidase family protein [Bacteroidales bacterium]|nr:peptidoglycan DD-metalloendopeptidase family protein [Bacteroidales bacterium]